MTVYKDVVCSFCGALCDHIEVTVENGEITSVKGACPISVERFKGVRENRLTSPMIRRNGELVEVSLEEAINRAVEILSNASWPLIYGLSSTTVEAIKKCIDIAEMLGGVIDQTASVCHGPTIQGFQEIGEITATLGEIKNRSDLVIYWGCNPFEAHVNHPIRYSMMAKGLYVSSRKDRFIVTIDVRKTRTAELSDLFIQVKPGRDHELISAIRAMLKGWSLSVEEVAGVPVKVISELVERMKKARYGVIFVGVGVTMSGGRELTTANLLRLGQELNDYTRFIIIPMRGHGNVKGAGMVLAWRTGYPFAVDFSRGYPRYGPGEFTAVDVLRRGEVDAALIVASDPAANFPWKAVKHLAKIPTIVIDPKMNLTAMISEVVIPCAFSGIEAEGTMYRMDGVPLRLKKILDPESSRILPDVEILDRIIRGLEAKLNA